MSCDSVSVYFVLAQINFTEGISLAQVMHVDIQNDMQINNFAEKFDFVFVDHTGQMNIMATMSEITIDFVSI